MRHCHKIPPYLLAFLFIFLAHSITHAQTQKLVVTNLSTNDELRYSVALLRGTLPLEATTLNIRNINAPSFAKPIKPTIHQGKFKALVQLSPGKNTLVLTTETDATPVRLQLKYKPQTNPYYVRLVWMTDNSGDTTFAAPTDDVPQDYEARLRTAALLMQTFTAERMHELGFGRRTFRLEEDKTGQVIVHTLQAPESKDEYYQQCATSDRLWYRSIYRWINSKPHSDPLAKNIVLAAYTRKDLETKKMKAHTALGGGNLGLFGSASVFSWPRDIQNAIDVFYDKTKVDPTRVHDDSAFRGTYWALASTTIGATLHEAGHAFGLPHTTDPRDIMTRGFDRFNRLFTFYDPPHARSKRQDFTPDAEAYFAPISASYLQWSRWFQLEDQNYSDDTRPQITIDNEKEQVTITSGAGIPWVGFYADLSGNITAHREIKSQPIPKEVKYSFAEIQEILGDKKPIRISTINTNGQASSKVF